jgi:hypothetical protein
MDSQAILWSILFGEGETDPNPEEWEIAGKMAAGEIPIPGVENTI